MRVLMVNMRMRIIIRIMIIMRMMSLMIILPGGRNCSKERQKGGSRVRDDFDQDDHHD